MISTARPVAYSKVASNALPPRSRYALASSCLFPSFWLFLACDAPREAVQVELPVVVDASKLEAITSDLGYEVKLTEARIAIRDLTFAVAGEAHTSLLRDAHDWLVPNTLAHPGHFQDGDITGELRGRFVLDWLPGRVPQLGAARLLEGAYTSANFVLERATKADLKNEQDELLGHTALLRGSARKEDDEISFLALIDSPSNRNLVGIPFETTIEAARPVELHLELALLDDLEGDTLFDRIDFAALDEDEDSHILLAPGARSQNSIDAYHLLRRTLQTHDHFDVRAIEVRTPEENQ